MRYDTKHLSYLNPHIMICDICGKEQMDSEHFLKLFLESSEGYGHEKYEICSTCEKRLITWLELNKKYKGE